VIYLNKKFYVIITILIIIIPIPTAFGQLSFGELAFQKKVVITINEQGEVHVSHKIRASEVAVQMETIEGTLSNLKVIKENGNDVQYATSGIGGITGITIFPSKTDVMIDYDLDNVIFLKEGIWTWNFLYLQTTTFILPKGLDLVYVNNNPVMLKDAKGITCHGCEAKIEYVLNEQIKIHQIHWEDRIFDIGTRTTEISSLNFNQTAKSISFNVEKENQLKTLIIPLELLWSPYEVFLDDTKILEREYKLNETHALLSIRPQNSGTIEIIGTTVIPEFPIIAPLFVGIAIVVALQIKNKSISTRTA
jgi:hypothetical protein